VRFMGLLEVLLHLFSLSDKQAKVTL